MCGIAGIVKKSGSVDPKPLETMAAAVRHRGPDDIGIYRDGRVGLAHTRLSIIDINGGHQPIVSEDGRYALVANGEIYNYIELREALIKAGRKFLTTSDSEVILHLVAEKGVEGLNELQGMFAFALYDKAKDSLLLGRDRLGIKPLFVARLADRVLFASELKALVKIHPGPLDIDPAALAEFFHNQFNSGTTTILKGIERLPPGHYLQVDADNRTQSGGYWRLADIKPWQGRMEEAEEAFEELFDQVIHIHQRSDVPYGLFLSGGLDSGSLLATLAPKTNYRLRTFSVGFAEDDSDEAAAAEAIARRFDTEHTTLRLSLDDLRGRIVQNVWACDELMRDYAVLPTLALSETAARELKVVFTGEGGDEVFAGYGRYRKHPLARLLTSLLRPGSGGFRTRSQIGNVWKRIAGARLTEAGQDFRRPFVSAWREAPPHWSPIQKSQYTDMRTALVDNLLVKVDRSTMAFGLEARVPFLDHRVVEFGLSLPDRLKVQGRTGKLLLRRWAERRLPREHIYRKKRGFHVPIEQVLTPDLARELGSKLRSHPAIREWFSAEGIDMLIRAKPSSDRNRTLWSLMQFALWYRLFVDGPDRTPGADEDVLAWL